MNSATEPTASTKTPRRAVHGTVRPLVLPSILGDSLAELNRLRDSITASMGIPAHLLLGDPPLHPTYSEYQAIAPPHWADAQRPPSVPLTGGQPPQGGAPC